MARILIAWEFGRNLGHIARDLPLARAARDAGHEVLWALPNLRAGVAELADEGFTLLQTPWVRPATRAARAPANFADMLLCEGYDDPPAVLGALHGWMALMKLARPAALVYDYAPTALLAAHVARVPSLVLGSGFLVPPLVSPLPSFQPWADTPAPVLAEAEARLVGRLNDAARPFGGAPLGRLADLYGQATQCLTTFEELDPFGPRPGARYYGPMFALGRQAALDWTTTGRPRIFAYLRPEVPGCEALLTALQGMDADVVCALPGLPPAWAQRFDRVRFHAGAVDMDRLLPGADAAITSGSGTIPTCLLAGVPVLVAPQFVEQYLAGLRLQEFGAGLTVFRPEPPAVYRALLERLVTDPALRAQARVFAARHAGHDREGTGRRVFEALQGLVSA
jgi:UDP:flavonoid glycosyltransferase YjiC (YdhE family)